MKFLDKLGLTKPLILAPMAGGPSSIDLIVAASEAGALGSLAAAYLPAEKIQEEVLKIQSRTRKPFAINLFTPVPDVQISSLQLQKATEACALYRQELGLTTPSLQPPYHPNFDEQFEIVLKNKPAVFSFIFGLLNKEYIQEAQKEGILVVGAATNPADALELYELHVDAIVLQGFEAGGHRALFTPKQFDRKISTLDLLKKVHTLIPTPLIAAGGIMNKTQIKSALDHGATAVQMGSAFLLTKEAGTSSPYRQALTKLPRQTELTRAFSGRWARGLQNRFLMEMQNQEDSILPYPAQNQWTRDLRNKSQQQGSSDFLSLWCGSGKDPLYEGSAVTLIQDLFKD